MPLFLDLCFWLLLSPLSSSPRQIKHTKENSIKAQVHILKNYMLQVPISQGIIINDD